MRFNRPLRNELAGRSSINILGKSKSLIKHAKETLDQLTMSGNSMVATPEMLDKVIAPYTDLEHGIALLKLHLRIESPNVTYQKKRGTVDYGDLLKKASKLLQETLLLLESERYEDSIGTARSARNLLKTIIAALRKI